MNNFKKYILFLAIVIHLPFSVRSQSFPIPDACAVGGNNGEDHLNLAFRSPNCGNMFFSASRTPDITFFQGIPSLQLGSNSTACGQNFTEIAYIETETPIKKGTFYSLSVNINCGIGAQNSINRGFKIKLSNSMTATNVSSNDPCDTPGLRASDVNGQDIVNPDIEPRVRVGFQTITYCFIASDNFSQIVFIQDPDLNETLIQLNGITLINKNGECVPNRIFIGNQVNGGHIALPELTLTEDFITVEPSYSDVIIKNGETVDFRSENTISINQSTFAFKVERGSNFTAKIEDCPDFNNVCIFTDDNWSSFPGQQNVFSPSATDPVNRVWKIRFPHNSYAYNFNAIWGEVSIFDRFGSIVFKKQYTPEGCDDFEIPEDYFIWDGCFSIDAFGTCGSQEAIQGVYAWQFKLLNCHGEEVFSGDVTKL